MKIKISLVIIFLQFLSIQAAFSEAAIVLGDVPLEQNENISFIPKKPNDKSEIIISRDQYLLSYNSKRRLLNWVEWKVEASDFGTTGRTNSFASDKDLEEYLIKNSEHAVTIKDYKGSCFDRGHQVPSADRTNSVIDNEMTFLLSNMTPQTAYLNRVIWKNLENHVRDLVKNNEKKVYIIAGPIFDEDFGKIGVNKDIHIPSKNFKVIFILNKDQKIEDINSDTEIISVIMPNRLKSGKKPLDDRDELCTSKVTDTINVPKSTDWHQYKTSIAEIEKLSGFKILPTKLFKRIKTKL